MFTKRSASIAALALCATLAACGGKNNDTTNNDTTNVQPNNTTNVQPNNSNMNIGNNCDGVTTCAAAGSSCSGSSAVVCAADANGCLVETTTDCTTTAQMCMGGACVDVDPCVDDAACAGRADGARFCTGDVLTTCADNGGGCLVASDNDCATAGQSCDMDTQACVTACTDDVACMGMADGDSYCDGAGYISCSTSAQGCLTAATTACNGGEVCDDTSGAASCASACTAALQTLSCADAGATLTFDSANGTNLVTDNGCNFFGDTYDAMEVFLTFNDMGNYEVTIDYTWDDTVIADMDAFALASDGTCTDPALTCENYDYGSAGAGSFDFSAAADSTHYLLFEPYGAAPTDTTTIGVTITCTPVVCGDGVIGAGETCDDMNASDGDGCSAACAEEANYICEGEPSACVPDVCGDGMLSPNESCDDTNTMDGDGCAADCTIEFGYECDANGANCTAYPSIGTFAAGDAIADTVVGAVAASSCDFHTITFSDTALVSGTVGGNTTGNPDVYIYTENSLYHRGEAVGAETFNAVVLAAGTYVIAVCSGAALDAYTLTLSSSALTSTNIGTFAAAAAIADTTGGLSDGRATFYEITFSENVLLSGSLTADTGDADLRILLASGAPFYNFATAGDETLMDVALPAGTYLLKVESKAGAGDIGTYTLALSTVALGATDIGTFAAGDTIADTVGGAVAEDDSEYYTITFSTDVTLSGTVTAPSGDVDFVMYSANGVAIVGFEDGDEAFMNESIAAGTYVIRVDAYLALTSYTLTLTAN